MGGGERKRDRGGEREREGGGGEREISTPSDCQSKLLQDAHASRSVFAGECSSILASTSGMNTAESPTGEFSTISLSGETACSS